MTRVMRDGITKAKVSKNISVYRSFKFKLEFPILFQDKLVFWGSLYAFPLVWVVFCVMNALTF